MVSTLLSRGRASFKKRSKAARSSRLGSRVQRGLISLLLGRSPEDARPEATEEATKWLDTVVGELEGKPSAENERKDTSDDTTR